jgi:tRNA-dihydrouridine synthase B
MKIGSVSIKNRLVLAPMARVTSLPFRLLCRKYGCGLVSSEMMNANALSRDNNSTMKKAISCDEERPVSMQLFGVNEALILAAAKMLPSDIIDVNFGCPDYEVVSMGAGSALLKRPEKIRKIIESLVKGQEKPVTAKIRIGHDRDHINAVEIAKIIESAGASAITVHGRTVAQKYSGTADWAVIKAVKEAVAIPVIANGDISDEASAEKCLRETGADFLMIGRAAIGEPYIFRRISHYLDTGELLKPQSFSEKLDDFFGYVALAKRYSSLNYAELKTHAQWFTRSTEGGRVLREKITPTKTVEEIISIMEGSRKAR